jgi:hypothetical protein
MDLFEGMLFSQNGVLIFNVGLLVLGAYSWSRANRFWAKVVLSAPFFALHLGVLPSVIIGCELSLIGSTFCREAIWLFVVLPPFLFAFGIIQLTVYWVFNRQQA